MPRNLSILAGIGGSALLAPIAAAPMDAQPRHAASAPQTGAPSIFGTVALPLQKTRYDDRWRLVLRNRAKVGQLPSLMEAAGSVSHIKQLQLVNASLNNRIRYRFDTDPSGDHWSTASETIARSSGDCEDYVIAKFQTLRALGVPEGDLFMTVGHDGVSGAIHAVLVARAKGQFFVLDNRTDGLIPHDKYGDFYPMLTFGWGSSWIHGYERGKMPAAVRRADMALQSGRELPIGSSRGSAVRAPRR